MRTERVKKSDFQLNEIEREWWNKNAEIIEKIWAQNLNFQKVVRIPYLSRMKKFFLNGTSKSPIKILEIGCGTGWVCRLIADEKLHVIGTDFSEGQLAIANHMAKEMKKEKYCHYELADASTFKKEVDGVVIQALLHHLSSEEIEEFFRQFSQLKPGTKVFIYEPVFFKRQNGNTSLKDKIINKLIYKIKTYSINKAKTIGKKDLLLSNAMDKINSDAEKNGWYISPKEIPFYEGELEKLLTPHCIMKRKYIVNKTDFDIAQALTMNSIESPNFLFSKILIPLAAKLDQISFKGKFTHYLHPYQHLFVCFELIKK